MAGVDVPMNGVRERAKAAESAKPLQRVAVWSKGFLSQKSLDLSSPKSPTTAERHHITGKAPPSQEALCVDTTVKSGDDEEEIELFLGFDDI